MILLALVTLTALCIYRNTPGMLREMRSYRVNMPAKARWKAFSHQTEFAIAASRPSWLAHGLMPADTRISASNAVTAQLCWRATGSPFKTRVSSPTAIVLTVSAA